MSTVDFQKSAFTPPFVNTEILSISLFYKNINKLANLVQLEDVFEKIASVSS